MTYMRDVNGVRLDEIAVVNDVNTDTPIKFNSAGVTDGQIFHYDAASHELLPGDPSGGTDTDTQFYLWGVTQIYQGGFFVPPPTPYPSAYFPSGIDYNQNPGQDHNTFGGSVLASFFWIPDPPFYTNTNPIVLFYGGPTDPSSISGASAQLDLTAYTVGSGGFTVVAQGTATPTGWTDSPNGNIGSYTGLWMTYDGLTDASQLSWDWAIPPTAPLS
jgi:hypothetical protein